MLPKHIPNLITALRIVAVAPICWLLWHDQYAMALVGLVLAGLSDAVDGFLARRYGWLSELGGFLDPLADKLLIVAITLLFGFKGYLPLWLVVLVIGRDVLILGGALVYRWVTGGLEMRPLLVSKVNTVLQILLLAVTLVNIGFYALPDWVNDGFQWAVAVLTFLSGGAYVFWWSYYAFHRGASV